MYEIADTIGNTMGNIWDFFSDMSIPKIIMIGAIAIVAIVLFQFKWTRAILGLAIGLAILAVVFAFTYGFIYALGGDGIIQLIFALSLSFIVASPAYKVIIIFLSNNFNERF